MLQATPFISAAYQYALDYLGEAFTAEDPEPTTWMHIQCIGRPVSATQAAERFVTTFDIVNVTEGQVDNTWTQTDMQQVIDILANPMLAWANPHMSNDATWQEVRFYHRSFTPLPTTPRPPGERDKPFTVSGAPAHIFGLQVAGTGTTFQAPQVAFTSTEKTPYPGHWGRNYWPRPAATQVVSGGFMSSGQIDTFFGVLWDTYDALMKKEFFPVVPVTQILKQPARALLGVTEIQCDNLLDVQRRRRQQVATYKKTKGLGP